MRSCRGMRGIAFLLSRLFLLPPLRPPENLFRHLQRFHKKYQRMRSKHIFVIEVRGKNGFNAGHIARCALERVLMLRQNEDNLATGGNRKLTEERNERLRLMVSLVGLKTDHLPLLRTLAEAGKERGAAHVLRHQFFKISGVPRTKGFVASLEEVGTGRSAAGAACPLLLVQLSGGGDDFAPALRVGNRIPAIALLADERLMNEAGVNLGFKENLRELDRALLCSSAGVDIDLHKQKINN